MCAPPNIVIVTDDVRGARALERDLASAGFRVQVATDTHDALQHDLVVLDTQRDVPDLAARMRELTCKPMLVLSEWARLEDRVAALEAGADDVLEKPCSVAELVARIRALLRGRALAVNGAQRRRGQLRYADIQLDEDTHEVRRAGRVIHLRHLAFELLAYFLRHPERVVGRAELMEKVWGYPFVGDANVVDVTVSRLRQALESGGEPRVIQTIRPIGYILRAR